jgi:hypothetical protein
MTRIYERDGKHYDFALLSHLVETGQATFFEGPGIFVIRTEEHNTIAVRPHQVIFTATPAPFEIVVPEEVDGEPEPVTPVRRSSGWVSATEADELLAHFTQ